MVSTFIGDVSGIIGIYQWAESLFPKPPADAQATVRIMTGLSGTATGLQNSGGKIDRVQLYNDDQQLIGNYGLGVNLDSGSYNDWIINQVNKQQPTYVQIFGGGPVCVAYVTMAFPDGSNYAFDGGFGKDCGMNWYPSDVYTGSGQTYTDCFWLDLAADYHINANMVMIHMPTFAGSGLGTNAGVSAYCGFPGLRIYDGNNQINYTQNSASSTFNQFDGVGAGTKNKRGSTPSGMEGSLVVSSLDSHSAVNVCNHPLSLGPDFVSTTEGFHCDMQTRQLRPLCNGTVQSDCFDVKATKHIGRRGISKRSYSDVVHWA